MTTISQFRLGTHRSRPVSTGREPRVAMRYRDLAGNDCAIVQALNHKDG